MKREDHVDFFLVADQHMDIHQRLEDWASWVRVRPHGWQAAPMFRQFRSNWRQWHIAEIRRQPNVPQALDMERAVSLLPEKHRTAVRWCYVFRGGPVVMARHLGVSGQGLADLIAQGRTMLINRSV